MHKSPILSCAVAAICFAAPSFAANTFDSELDSLKNHLIYQTDDGWFYVEGGVQVDWTGYYTDNDQNNPPGFFFPHDGKRFDWSPRLTLTLDAWVGERLYAFVKFRHDDGVHPGVSKFYEESHDSRFDEFFLRYQVLGSALEIQAGQFVPKMGNFLSRQDNWDSGLISYPAMYEQITSVSDTLVPASAADFAARRDLIDFPYKVLGLPAYWAQLYTRGVSAFGTKGDWDYALNFTNRAPSSRGVTWNDNDWSHPSYMASVGYKPSPAWRIGLTGTYGAYLQDSAEAALPAGKDVGDYMQRNLGLDVTWQRGHWQVWAEFVHTQYELPNVSDDAEFFSYYVEARYNFRPRWWASARWNHQIYSEIDTATGSQDWDNDHIRVDLGLGHRPTRHTQIKLQYSHQHQQANFQNAEHFVALEASLKL